MHKAKLGQKIVISLLIAIVTGFFLPLWAETATERATAHPADGVRTVDPDSFLLAVWARAPLQELLVTTEQKVLPTAERVEQSLFLTSVLPRIDTERDGAVKLRFPGEREDLGEWGIYLLPGWEPRDIVAMTPARVRQNALAFREGSGKLPREIELRPKAAGEWVMYLLPGRAPEDISERSLGWLRQQSLAYIEGSGAPPEDIDLAPEMRLPDDRREEARRERQLPAAMRFAMLPRFGQDLFAEPPALSGADLAAARRPASDDPARREQPESMLALGQAVPQSYVIGPGDELAVRVWTRAVEHVATTATVSSEGNVYLGLVGELAVGGRSLADAREMLSRSYNRFFEEAQVSVVLARTRVIEVRVTGDAQRPGKHRLSGAATVFSALYAAGGPGEIGSLRNIRLIRRGEAPRQVDIYAYLIEGDAEADLILEPEDTILIPPAGSMIGLTGEVQRAARYELDRETTIIEALEMAGGLKGTGDPSRIEVWRIADDGRRHLLNLDARDPRNHDFTAEAGDLIVVEPVLEDTHNIVEISGAVTRPGSYQYQDGMTVSDLLTRARGITPGAHTRRALIWRLNEQMDYEHMRFDLASALAGLPEAQVGLQPRDQVIVLFEDEVEAPRQVEVEGAVRRPGTVAWREGMQVSDLIAMAGGLTEKAYTGRANLLRLRADQKREIIPVKLGEALGGGDEADLRLARGDLLEVLERFQVMVEGQVQVGGYVNEPDRYRRFEGMRVSDAIMAAGGLAPAAGREIQYTPGGDTTEVTPVMLVLRKDGAEPGVDPDPVLRDDDLVTVLGEGTVIGQPRYATIHGRVARPGTYAVEGPRGAPDTVYDLLERAGGMLPGANPNGIILYRMRDEIIADEQAEDLAQMISTFNRGMLEDTVEADRQRTAGVAGQVAEGLRTAFSQHDRALIIPPRRLDQDAWARAVPIDGELMMQTRGERGNFDLVHGDILIVPETPNTITLMGALVRPGALAWREELTALQYIDRAGGTAPDADMSRTVLIRANGAVEADALQSEIRPGDIILVPSDYMIREIGKPSTLDRVLSGITSILGAYLLFR